MKRCNNNGLAEPLHNRCGKNESATSSAGKDASGEKTKKKRGKYSSSLSDEKEKLKSTSSALPPPSSASPNALPNAALVPSAEPERTDTLVMVAQRQGTSQAATGFAQAQPLTVSEAALPPVRHTTSMASSSTQPQPVTPNDPEMSTPAAADSLINSDDGSRSATAVKTLNRIRKAPSMTKCLDSPNSSIMSVVPGSMGAGPSGLSAVMDERLTKDIALQKQVGAVQAENEEDIEAGDRAVEKELFAAAVYYPKHSRSKNVIDPNTGRIARFSQ